MSEQTRPSLVLEGGGKDQQNTVLMVHAYLDVDGKLIGFVLEAQKGREAEAAMAAFKLGELSATKPQRK